MPSSSCYAGLADSDTAPSWTAPRRTLRPCWTSCEDMHALRQLHTCVLNPYGALRLIDSLACRRAGSQRWLEGDQVSTEDLLDTLPEKMHALHPIHLRVPLMPPQQPGVRQLNLSSACRRAGSQRYGAKLEGNQESAEALLDTLREDLREDLSATSADLLGWANGRELSAAETGPGRMASSAEDLSRQEASEVSTS